METKQTAVQFLIEHIKQDVFVHSKSTKEWNQVFAQAKQMEKGQIIDAVEWNYKSNMGEVYYQARYGTIPEIEKS